MISIMHLGWFKFLSQVPHRLHKTEIAFDCTICINTEFDIGTLANASMLRNTFWCFPSSSLAGASTEKMGFGEVDNDWCAFATFSRTVCNKPRFFFIMSRADCPTATYVRAECCFLIGVCGGTFFLLWLGLCWPFVPFFFRRDMLWCFFLFALRGGTGTQSPGAMLLVGALSLALGVLAERIVSFDSPRVLPFVSVVGFGDRPSPARKKHALLSRRAFCRCFVRARRILFNVSCTSFSDLSTSTFILCFLTRARAS